MHFQATVRGPNSSLISSSGHLDAGNEAPGRPITSVAKAATRSAGDALGHEGNHGYQKVYVYGQDPRLTQTVSTPSRSNTGGAYALGFLTALTLDRCLPSCNSRVLAGALAIMAFVTTIFCLLIGQPEAAVIGGVVTLIALYNAAPYRSNHDRYNYSMP